MVKEKIVSMYSDYKHYFPALSFLAGFLWDSITLGGRIDSADLWILAGYYIGTTVVVSLISFEKSFRWSDKLPMLLQFLHGSLFSALVVFYFKSTHTIGAYVSVCMLLAILIANEFWESNYSKREFMWGVYCLCATMFLNFLIPHIFGSISVFWFLLSLVLGLVPIVVILKRLELPYSRLKIPASISLIILAIYTVDLIPPVPLVLKDQVICRDFSLVEGKYTCAVEKPSFFEKIGLSSPVVHAEQDETLWCLSSVFAPASVGTVLEHRWLYYDVIEDEWKLVDTVPFTMKGGRENGWRFYSSKSHWKSGWWKVAVAIQDGPIIGFTKFQIREATAQKLEKYILP